METSNELKKRMGKGNKSGDKWVWYKKRTSIWLGRKTVIVTHWPALGKMSKVSEGKVRNWLEDYFSTIQEETWTLEYNEVSVKLTFEEADRTLWRLGKKWNSIDCLKCPSKWLWIVVFCSQITACFDEHFLLSASVEWLESGIWSTLLNIPKAWNNIEICTRPACGSVW